MKAYLLFLFIVLTGTAYSQGSINNYKYVLVPEKFDFLREPDQYGLNNATKFLLEQKGFVVYIGQLPPDVVANKCDALMAEVTQRKGFLVTNLTLQPALLLWIDRNQTRKAERKNSSSENDEETKTMP